MMASTNAVPSERIRERAFELWDRNHRPEGLDIRFWLLAERELRAEAHKADLPLQAGDGDRSRCLKKGDVVEPDQRHGEGP
jgi:hypothetical protein